MGYLYPVPFTRSTSWNAHRRRNPPSQEPGIDMFCPIGTPVLAAENGRIADTGDSIAPATGRFVTINLDDGRRVRYLHLKSRTVSIGTRVTRRQVVGYSGATGYGEEDWSWNVADTGGAHVHMTLWPLHVYAFGPNGSLDPEQYFDSAAPAAGSTSEPFKPKGFLMALSDQDQENVKNDVAELKRDIAQIKTWLRGDNPDVDRLTEFTPLLRDLYKRIRGDNPNFDNVQDDLGQNKEIRALLERIDAALSKSDAV